MRRGQRRGLSAFQVGAIVLVVLGILTYLGFTKSIPFRHHFEIKADFKTSNNLRKASFVRIAGVNVGKVTKIEPIHNGQEGVRVTMRIDKKGLPIHKDATIAIRPRIFLEGNFFLDVHPGTPSAPDLGDGDVIPASQTVTPVQLDQVLTSLQSNTRTDLQILLRELARGLAGKGGIGYNRSIGYWESAFKNSAIVNEATLGQTPHDLSGYLRGAAGTAAALDRNPQQLQNLITDFNTTAHAFAIEQGSLERTVAELPRTLRAGRSALGALNTSFPPLRRLIVDFRPAVRSSGPAIDASIPFVTQARLLVRQSELRGLVSDLRPTVPALARLNANSVPLYRQIRLASSCQNDVILPWTHDTVPDSVFPANGPVYEEQVKFLPGLAAESRSGDANGQWARVLGGNGAFAYALGNGEVGNTNFPLLGVKPPKSANPPIRYDVPCETQQSPDLRTETGPAPTRVRQVQPPADLTALANAQAYDWLARELRERGYPAKARQAAARSRALRVRYGLMGERLGLVRGRLRPVKARSGGAAAGTASTSRRSVRAAGTIRGSVR